MAAADVGDAGASLEPLDDAVERRQPGADEVRVVAGPEEPLAAVVDVVVVLVPADADAAAGGLGDLRRVEHRAERDLEEPRQVGRAVGVGQRDGVLGREAEPAVLRTRRSRRRPGRSATRARSARGCRSASASSRGGQRAGVGQRAVEAEPVAHHDQRGVQRRADLVDGAEDELLELGGSSGGFSMAVMAPSLAARPITCNCESHRSISRTDAGRPPAACAVRGRGPRLVLGRGGRAVADAVGGQPARRRARARGRDAARRARHAPGRADRGRARADPARDRHPGAARRRRAGARGDRRPPARAAAVRQLPDRARHARPARVRAVPAPPSRRDVDRRRRPPAAAAPAARGRRARPRADLRARGRCPRSTSQRTVLLEDEFRVVLPARHRLTPSPAPARAGRSRGRAVDRRGAEQRVVPDHRRRLPRGRVHAAGRLRLRRLHRRAGARRRRARRLGRSRGSRSPIRCPASRCGRSPRARRCGGSAPRVRATATTARRSPRCSRACVRRRRR